VDNVGQRLKEERQLRGWSQRDLARETGVNTDTISGIETGQHEPRPSTLRKLAWGLGIEVRDFFQEPALPKAEAPRGVGLTEWNAAVRNARRLREYGHSRMEELLSSWRRSKNRQYLSQMGELLQRAYDAESALLQNVQVALDAPAHIEGDNPAWEEVRDANLFYLTMLEMLYDVGLYVRREHEAHDVEEAA
jgi:transcriptional regulator with XRE-family HTH domain